MYGEGRGYYQEKGEKLGSYAPCHQQDTSTPAKQDSGDRKFHNTSLYAKAMCKNQDEQGLTLALKTFTTQCGRLSCHFPHSTHRAYLTALVRNDHATDL
jgi:hypothetical protein